MFFRLINSQIYFRNFKNIGDERRKIIFIYYVCGFYILRMKKPVKLDQAGLHICAVLVNVTNAHQPHLASFKTLHKIHFRL